MLLLFTLRDGMPVEDNVSRAAVFHRHATPRHFGRGVFGLRGAGAWPRIARRAGRAQGVSNVDEDCGARWRRRARSWTLLSLSLSRTMLASCVHRKANDTTVARVPK